MISKVEIRNFSIHKKQDIEFSPNVTTITGSSFFGKSTILRAIRFVCVNRPSGDKFISWDADKASVRLTIDEKKITRRKGKGVNSYKLSGYKDPFTGFNTNVPKPIADLVNMSDINFQGQHEAPFWFCESPPEVSRQLNKIVNLEVIDKTLTNIASGIRKANTTIEITQNRLDDVIEDKKELAYIIELDKDLIEIEELEQIQSKIAVESTTLRDIIEKVDRYSSQRDNAAQANLSGLAALDKGSIWLKIKDLIETLDNHVKTGIRANKVIQDAPEPIVPLNRLKVEWIGRGEERKELKDLISDIENSEGTLFDTKMDLKQTEIEFKKIMKERCPLCGSKMMKK